MSAGTHANGKNMNMDGKVDKTIITNKVYHNKITERSWSSMSKYEHVR